MPKMGESISEGTILNWLVPEGETFDEGDILVEVATDKVDNEVPAPAAGVMERHLAEPNEVVSVGTVIATFVAQESGTGESKVKNGVLKKAAPTAKVPKPPVHKKTNISKKTPATHTDIFVSPLVDKIARTHHISYEELARINGSGIDGRLRKTDVISYIDEGRPYKFAQPVAQVDPNAYTIPQLKFDKGKGKRVKMDRMRQMIADHMVYSKHTSPHVAAYVEADLTELVLWYKANKVAFLETHGEKLTYTPLFIEATAKALLDFPMINITADGHTIIMKDKINIGMATTLPSGNLIVPVIKNADKKTLRELAKDVNHLSVKARDNSLKTDDIQGGTFTVSNVGTFGGVMGTPIINQPEAAILATGIIRKRAGVIERPEGDSIEVRYMTYLSISFDHRIIDGHLGGSFLRRIADYMEQFDPERTIYD